MTTQIINNIRLFYWLNPLNFENLLIKSPSLDAARAYMPGVLMQKSSDEFEVVSQAEFTFYGLLARENLSDIGNYQSLNANSFSSEKTHSSTNTRLKCHLSDVGQPSIVKENYAKLIEQLNLRTVEMAEKMGIECVLMAFETGYPTSNKIIYPLEEGLMVQKILGLGDAKNFVKSPKLKHLPRGSHAFKSFVPESGQQKSNGTVKYHLEDFEIGDFVEISIGFVCSYTTKGRKLQMTPTLNKIVLLEKKAASKFDVLFANRRLSIPRKRMREEYESADSYSSESMSDD